MNGQTWQRVRELFDALVDTPIAQRAIRLEELLAIDLGVGTGGDQDAIRSEVFAMLAADAQDMLKTNMDALAPELLSQLSEADSNAQHQVLTGLRLGAFCLVRELGRGGMGTVWLADRVDGEFEQQVAIKLIQPGWHAAETNARFRAERQILAGLTHPNIAHLIDGGMTADGRPWLALEYVDGLDLSQYCDQNRLTIAHRLQLFLTVCDAVSHAHARLIVHRDLKPSNLLVTASGTVKLLDFGIAKLIAPDAKISQTRIFTPEYASPEQVRGEAITTSVDVYALGLLLYGLLTGRRPYKLQNSTPAAYERAILEQEPTRPSVAVTRDEPDTEQLAPESDTTDFQEAKTGTGRVALTVQHGLSAERLKRELRGDLDAIVLKALRKNPNERYASAADFAADIGNYLARRPVQARRGGWRYRSIQFMRRHGVVVGLSATALLALFGGLIAALYQRDLARVAARKSEIVLEFMVDNFRLADSGNTNGEKITARELLDRGAQRITASLHDLPEVRAQLLESIGRSYGGLALYDKQLELINAALKLRQAQGDVVALANVLAIRAHNLNNLSRGDEARVDIERAQALVADFPNSKTARHVESEVAYLKGIHLYFKGRFDDSKKELQHSLKLRTALYGSNDERAIDSALFLTRVLSAQEDYVSAERNLDEIVWNLRKESPARDKLLAQALDALGAIYVKLQRFDRAEVIRRETAVLCEKLYGPEHFVVAIQLNNLGYAQVKQQRFEAAIEPLQRAVAIARKNLVPEHGFTAAALKNLGDAEFGAKQYALAKRDYESVLAILNGNSTSVISIDRANVEAKIKACETFISM